jgi:tetrahydromethanopterin:alpha-L-glutamate ligase
MSEPHRLELAVDRYRMTLELARAGLPIPETVVTEDVEEAEATVTRFGAAILKPLFTSKGRGMERLEPSSDVRASLERHRDLGFGPFYLQRAIEHPGRYLGIAVLDGAYLGAYWRVAGGGGWMTTIRAGGRYERAEPPPWAVDLVVTAAKHFGLFFTGVDLMETPDGGFVVLEVSAFGGFRGLAVASGIDAASRLADRAIRRVRERQ